MGFTQLAEQPTAKQSVTLPREVNRTATGRRSKRHWKGEELQSLIQESYTTNEAGGKLTIGQNHSGDGDWSSGDKDNE